MKRILVVVVLICCVATMFACSDTDGDMQYNVIAITSDEAKNMLDTGEYVLLDVRTQEEYDEKHIPNSILITIDKTDVEPFKAEVRKQLTDNDAKIIVYCMSGFRSDIAAKAMSTLGYKTIYNMSDGIEGWKYETEAADVEVTK